MTKKEKKQIKEICDFEGWAICQHGKKCVYDLRMCIPQISIKECQKCFEEFKDEKLAIKENS